MLSPRQYAIALLNNAGIETDHVTAIEINPDGRVTASFTRRLPDGQFETWNQAVRFSEDAQETPPSPELFTDETQNIPDSDS